MIIKAPFKNQHLKKAFFDRDACELAQQLLGKIICVKQRDQWLMARIIETEAYYITEKGSHSSLGYTEKRKALFMPPGTIYMYYARGGDSLNVSAQGKGNAVLIKSGIIASNDADMLALMQKLNPQKNNGLPREKNLLCKGQTLLCKSLGLKVPDWDARQFDPKRFYLTADDYKVAEIIQTTRLGIPPARDPHLPYRFIDKLYVKYCTRKPKITGASS
jgi:DNA-3-methyladenine glycosylase